MASWGNLRNWLGGGVRDREIVDTRNAWNETERLWQQSALADTPVSDHALAIVQYAMRSAPRSPSIPILLALCEATEAILRLEDIGALDADWPIIESNATIAVAVRQMLARRQRFIADFDRSMRIVAEQLVAAYHLVFNALPESCFVDAEEGAETFEVPLLSIIENPIGLIQAFTMLPYSDATMAQLVGISIGLEARGNQQIGNQLFAQVQEQLASHGGIGVG